MTLLSPAMIKMEALIRLGKVCFQPPNVVVTEYPRSGGTWVGGMIAAYLDLPFPRNRTPGLKPCVLHGHYRYIPTRKRNIVVVLRDGRDVMVSYYFHCYFKNELFNHFLVERMQGELPFDDYNDVENNLPRFIEYAFSRKKWPGFTWSEFVESWIGRDVAVVRYENLLDDPVSEMAQALERMTDRSAVANRISRIAAEHRFEKMTKRKPGRERRGSFARKGVAGN